MSDEVWTPEEVVNDGPATCIGRGTPDKGCGHTQEKWLDGVCPECGGMLFTPRMEREYEEVQRALREAGIKS